jgi:CheY-like chemotaxis protein
MPYSPGAINLGGALMIAASTVASGGAWAVHKAIGIEPIAQLAGPPVAEVASQLGSNAVWVGVGGIVTIIVNGWLNRSVALAKIASDTAQKVAESEDRTATQVAKALRQRDAEVAEALRLRDGEVAEALRRKDAETAARDSIRESEHAASRAHREAEREFAAIAMLKLHEKIDMLEAGGGKVAGKAEAVRVSGNTNTEAIIKLADATHTDVPLAREVPPDLAPVPVVSLAPTPAIDPSLPKLLLLEDSVEILDRVGRLLKMEGWDVTLATNGIQGSHYANSMSEDFDVIAVDLKIPGVPGPDVIDLFRKSHKHSRKTGGPVRIVAYTGSDSNDPMVARAIANGADAVLFKRGDLDALTSVLKGDSPGDVPIPAPSGLEMPPARTP